MKSMDLPDIGRCVSMNYYGCGSTPKRVKCSWREVYESNQRGIGTSFNGNKSVPCATCDGLTDICDKYTNE